MRRIFSFLILLICSACSSASKEPIKPNILVTIPPYAHLVKTLIGNEATIEVVVPPGSNPHTYEPTPEQIQRFTQAKVWFRLGDPIEQKMVQFLEQYQIDIINLSEKWELLDVSAHHHVGHQHEEKDLHLWMDPLIVLKQVEEMAAVLAQLLPKAASIIDENRQKLIDSLVQINRDINLQIAPFQGRYLLVSHPALGYFCLRYHLHQLSVETEGKDPLPQDIALLMQEVKSHAVPVLLIEPQYNNKGALLIAGKLHLPFEEVDPYTEDYFGMLNHLTQVIVKYYGHSNP